MSDGNVPLPKADTIDEIEQANIFVVDADSGEKVRPELSGGRLLVETQLTDEGITLESKNPISDQSAAAGVANAVELHLVGRYSRFDLYLNVAAAGTIRFEVSSDGDTWRPFDEYVAESGGGEDLIEGTTGFEYIRVYADGGDYADADVNALEISATE